MNFTARSGAAAIILLFSSHLISANESTYNFSLLPTPQSIEYSTGSIDINRFPGLRINGKGSKVVEQALSLYGIKPTHLKNEREELKISTVTDTGLPAEGYSIKVEGNEIILSSSSESGLYYGAVTAAQMINQARENCGGMLRECTVTDSPRFGYRGMMIDVSRCYLPLAELKRMVDQASKLKINNLHLHLTDDNGWRLEIKKYPRLASVGGWRVDRPEIFPGRLNATSADEPATYGGIYSQDEMRDLVAYASERKVNIIPEIELPAHSAAAIASYPGLACPVDSGYVGVFPGIGGKDANIIMCGGNDEALQFYKDVLDEVMDIFPSPKIHLGGDEANKTRWKKCPRCQERIRENGLKDEEALQGWFMDRIADHVVKAGRTPVGWDEATYGNPTKDMTIMGWQGMGKVAVEDARKSGRKFIMTPALKLYLIRYQGPQWFEPLTYFGNNTLTDVYNYEPVESDWSPELESQLEGIQGSLWTEFCRTPADVEYLLFPRMLAVAERGWVAKGHNDWEGFLKAADLHLSSLDKDGIISAKSMYNIQHKATPQNGKVTITLESERPDLDIRYGFDNPVFTDAVTYSGPIVVDGSPSTIFAATFDKNGKQAGQTLALPIIWNYATGKKVTGNAANGLQDVLTNGVRGSYRNSDFEWAGWYDQDASFEVDLGEPVNIGKVTLGSFVSSDLGIAAPRSVTLEVSADGNNFVKAGELSYDDDTVWRHDASKIDHQFAIEDGLPYRYLRFSCTTPGKVPDGLARSGSPVWMYFDEVMVENK